MISCTAEQLQEYNQQYNQDKPKYGNNYIVFSIYAKTKAKA